MINYNPPIKERETEVLVYIAHCLYDNWYEDAVEQAKEELCKRNISIKAQNKIIEKLKKEHDEYEKEMQEMLQINESKKYSLLQLIWIFIISPLILLGKIDYDMSVSELNKEHYFIKSKQRKTTLIIGAFVYISVFYLLTKK